VVIARRADKNLSTREGHCPQCDRPFDGNTCSGCGYRWDERDPNNFLPAKPWVYDTDQRFPLYDGDSIAIAIAVSTADGQKKLKTGKRIDNIRVVSHADIDPSWRCYLLPKHAFNRTDLHSVVAVIGGVTCVIPAYATEKVLANS
jgi:uncharacterized Zn ribbon protein